MPLGVVASLKRLLFVAHTLAISEIKGMVEEPGAEAGVKELPMAERVSRINEQKQRLAGRSLVGDAECGHCCYDFALQMVEKNVVMYMPPSRFATRQAELSSEKDAHQRLQVKDGKSKVTCETHSELLLTQALLRRALALDLTGIVSFAVMESYNSFLIRHLQSQAPPGYERTSVRQVLEADRQAWIRLAELLPGGVRRLDDGTLPLDAQFPSLQTDPKVSFYLLPLPSQSSSSTSDATKRQSDGSSSQRSNFPKGSGKGKKGGPRNIPAELVGKVTQTRSGKPVCFGYNMACGCPHKVKPGAQCLRGLHVCAEPKCGKNHSMQDHPAVNNN